MGNKKVKLPITISALFSVVNSTQNGLENFEKISEIIKIKFILKKVIKKREKMGNIKSIEINKFEKLKKFRDLNSLKLMNKDKSDKFKDFQEIYSLITKCIKNTNRKWLYSQKDKISYVFSQNRLITSPFYSEGSLNNDRAKLKEISDKFKDYKIEFNVPNYNELQDLNNIGFLDAGYWYYLDNRGYYYSTNWKYNTTYNAIGIYSINDFKDTLNERNQSFKLENNVIKEFNKKMADSGIEVEKYSNIYAFYEDISCMDIFNQTMVQNIFYKMENDNNDNKEISPKEFLKRYRATLLENEELQDFEVILNYNLLDTHILNGEKNLFKFNNLVNMYKTYNDYISCIYMKDNIEETVELVFNADKIISFAENRHKLFNGIEISYKSNNFKVIKEEIYNDKNIFYFEDGDREEINNFTSEEKSSTYYFSNGDIEKRSYKNGVLEGESTLTYKNGLIERREYKNGILEGKRILTYENGENETREYKNGILSEESTYYFKNGDIEKRNYKNGVLEGKSTYTYKNGDIEEREYKNGILREESTYYFKNGDIEKRKTKNGVLEGKSIYISTDGSIEEREYKNGILQGEVVYEKNGHKKKYLYTDGIKEEMPLLKYYLSIDKERINIDDYQENMFIDPNIGHWDLKEEDKKELKEILGKNVYKKDPKKDINQGGIVAIDFGTKNTVVVYQKDRENILPMRISGEKLNREVRNTDYENPTVIEFRDIDKFLKDYNAKVGRPETKWQNITVSHNAFRNLVEGTDELSIISDIKQWCASKNENIVIVDRKGKEILLPPYLELNEKSKDYLDPVEIYAYYIGSYINNMINGIYLEYYLSFPVTYEKAIRERILKSFEKGIQKSLPIEIQEDKDLMKKFRVRHGANEPAAFAVCALSKLEIEPKNEEDKIYYGVFDFGGGTTDFDFGIWKYSEDEDLYDYELEHFGAGGERYLGGENILKELAYKVFTDNSSNLRKNKIQYTRPEWYAETVGEEILVSKTREARINTRRLMEYIRIIWEDEGKDRERIDIINCPLFDTNGNFNAMELIINEDELKSIIREKIEKGIKNFFIKMEDAFKGEDVKEINIFLAGNSCKHPFVEEIFNSYIEKKKDKFKINIYDTKMFEKLKDTKKTNPTAKTGVAFGLIYSRNSGRIKVTSRDEKANMNNEINFKFYVGNNRRNKFNCIISPNSNYDEYKFFGIVKSDIFELYYSTSPEAQTNEMKSSEAKIKRVNLKKDYDEEERYRIYLKADESDKLVYAIVKEEKDIETKKFVEEGEISLN